MAGEEQKDTDTIPLNRVRVSAMFEQFSRIAKAQLMFGEPGNNKVLELLNAHAAAVATILVNTGPAESACAFFDRAVNNQIKLLAEARAAEAAKATKH